MKSKLRFVSVFLCVVCAQCSNSGEGAPDLGIPPSDLRTPDDLSTASDLAPPGPTMLSLVAGGLGGAGNADDIGMAARFNTPYGGVADGAGNLYVADTFNHTIRKIVLASGVVTTVAGAPGTRGTADGIGGAARFYNPQGLALDGAGNLFVADTNNRAIRKIVLASGAVSTYAGSAGVQGNVDGMGTAARFNGPSGMVVDGSGNLFVTDIYSHTIRKIVLNTAAVSTFAGLASTFGSTDGMGTAARFYQPSAVTVDGSNLYVADNANHTIRKIVLGTAAVTTFAGTAGMIGSTDATGTAARFNAPYGIAADGAGSLLVTDSGSNTIRQIVITSAAVTTFAGTASMQESTDGTGSAARFFHPFGLFTDGTGNLFVADSDNHAIRKLVLNTAAVTTIAGAAIHSGNADGTGAAARFLNPHALTIDSTGNLFVADTDNSTIRQIVPSTGAVTTLAGTAGVPGGTDGVGAAAGFRYPAGIAADGAGNLFVADTFNHVIRKIVISSATVTTVAGVAGIGGNADGIGTVARFAYPYGIATDGAGNLFVADTLNRTIRRIVISSGQVTTLAGSAGVTGSADGTGSAALFYDPYGVVADGAGNVFVADTINNTIRKIVINTQVVTTLAGTAGTAGSADGTGGAALFSGPSKLALDGKGNLFVGDWSNHTIRKIVLSTAAVSTVFGAANVIGVKPGPLPGRLNQPTGLAFSSSGQLFMVNRGENAVLVVQ